MDKIMNNTNRVVVDNTEQKLELLISYLEEYIDYDYSNIDSITINYSDKDNITIYLNKGE